MRKLQEKEAMKKAVAKAARRRSMAGERAGVKWRAIKKEAKQWQKPGRRVQARGIGAFLGVEEIGPPQQRETMILQRKGTRVEPPKHWSREQVELQEQRDLVLMSRAAGTWKAYDRWWGLFSTFVTKRGGETRQWRRDSEQGE